MRENFRGHSTKASYLPFRPWDMPVPMSSGFHLSIKESAVTCVAPLKVLCPICLLSMLCLSSISYCFLDIPECIFVFISAQDNAPL